MLATAHRRARPAMLAALLIVTVVSPDVHAVTVRFDPAADTRAVGEVFTVQILADLGTQSSIGWGLDLDYDTNLLLLTQPPEIGSYWQAAFANDGDGLTGSADPFSDPDGNLLFGSIGGDNVLLATLTFEALAPGLSPLTASVTDNDLNEGFALDPTGFADIVFENGTVHVVPEPLHLPAMLLALSVWRRRNRRHPSCRRG